MPTVPIVLHVLDSVGTGGLARSVISVSESSARSGGPSHVLASLRPPSDAGRALAAAAGLRVVEPRSDDELFRLVAGADVVQVEYCNHPAIVRLARLPLPACRLLAWFHVAGHAPPHVITRWWVSFVDVAVATSEFSFRLPAFGAAREAAFVHAPADSQRVSQVRPIPHAGFNVGFVGTVDFTKLHDAYVEMHAAAAARIPRLTCFAWGSGTFSTDESWFVRRGPVDDLTEALGLLDVYAYPLRPGTYASSELNLQEAMWAGLPAVVFPHGGVGGLVCDGETGLVVTSVDGYADALARLAADPAQRAAMGAAGRRRAEARFPVGAAAERMNALYDALLRAPKREHPPAPPSQPELPDGSSLFVDSWGEFGEVFPIAPAERGDAAREAAVAALASEPILVADAHGSPFHYLRFHPGDPFLSYWCELLRRGQAERRC